MCDDPGRLYARCIINSDQRAPRWGSGRALACALATRPAGEGIGPRDADN
jgi:hypothetical protein